MRQSTALGILLSYFLIFLTWIAPAHAGQESFTAGLKLYHDGHYEKAFGLFRDLHRHQPSGTGKFQYFMALSAHHQGLENEALMDLEGAIHTNPALTFTNNPNHVRSLHRKLLHKVQEGQSPVPPPHPVSFAQEPVRGSSHILPFLALFGVGAVLLILAVKRFSQKKTMSDTHDKTDMEETAGRLMKAVDKLIEDKNYYLLDHPDRKEVVEGAFRALDQPYRNVLNILREPETPSTNWTERKNRFEEALAPVDASITNIRRVLGEGPEDRSSAVSSQSGIPPAPPPPDAGKDIPPPPQLEGTGAFSAAGMQGTGAQFPWNGRERSPTPEPAPLVLLKWNRTTREPEHTSRLPPSMPEAHPTWEEDCPLET
ncbi:MAG: hypothetical protein VST70_10055 [Nitrospirota bacterium]|nr:hypothetical protein [Nitrospirota bacterium]